MEVNLVKEMARVLKILLYGPECLSSRNLLRKIYDLYREASMYSIRRFGSSISSEAVEYCSFKIGSFIFEVYVPPTSNRLRILRNNLIKKSDGIIFVIPSDEQEHEKVLSHILETRKILSKKYGPENKSLPVIFAINTEDEERVRQIVESLNLGDSIIWTFSFGDEISIREIFGKITFLVSLKVLDLKKFFIEIDRLKAESYKYLKREVEISEVREYMEELEIPMAPLPDFPELGITPVQQQKELPIYMPEVPAVSSRVKTKFIENYVVDVVLFDFDSSYGFYAKQAVFGNGKIIRFVKSPVDLAELSIIAKHSIGCLLRDGLTFIGFVPAGENKVIALETSVSHIRKMCNLVCAMRKKLRRVELDDIRDFIKKIKEIL